jgi:hypothetical protein
MTENGNEQPAASRAFQPRPGRTRQLRRSMTRMTSAAAQTAQAAPGGSDEAATQRRPAKTRQLRTTKQASAPAATAPIIKAQRARSVQMRQLGKSKFLATAVPEGARAALPKVARARVAQVAQKATRAVARSQ